MITIVNKNYFKSTDANSGFTLIYSIITELSLRLWHVHWIHQRTSQREKWHKLISFGNSSGFSLWELETSPFSLYSASEFIVLAKQVRNVRITALERWHFWNTALFGKAKHFLLHPGNDTDNTKLCLRVMWGLLIKEIIASPTKYKLIWNKCHNYVEKHTLLWLIYTIWVTGLHMTVLKRT